MEKSDNNTSNETVFTKIFWITFTPLFGLLGYSAIYLTGVVYHQIWINHFNVGTGLFEKSTTDYFIYAYVALIQVCSNWLNVLTDPWIILSTLGSVAFLVVEVMLLAWLSRPNKKRPPTALLARIAN